MHPFSALGHLLWKSLTSLVGGWMGTSLLAVVIGGINYFIAPYVDGWLHGERPVKKPRLTGSVILTVIVWLLLYGLSVVETVYRNHESLVRDNIASAAKLTSQERELAKLKASLEQDEERINALTVPEGRDSLRRRTMRVADELYEYLKKRAAEHPPQAYPDSRDPNPTDERKKAIQICQKYDLETQDYYLKHFRDRMVGIVKEYESKGVTTRYLENDFKQRVPGVMAVGSAWEGSSMDELSQFRDLSYHVDARDHLIVF